ncbi:MAG: hypothetical protein WDA21_02880 [Bacilli bacterium]
MGKQILITRKAQKDLYKQFANFYGVGIDFNSEKNKKHLLDNLFFMTLKQFILYLNNIDYDLTGLIYINEDSYKRYLLKQKNQTIVVLEEMIKEAIILTDCDKKIMQKKAGPNIIKLKVSVYSDLDAIFIDGIQVNKNKRGEKRAPYCRSKFKRITAKEVLEETGMQYNYK